MSHRGYKIVACIPAGRQRVLYPNLNHLRAQQGFVDEVQLWLNTPIHHDVEFIKAQESDYIKVIPLDDEEPSRKPIQRNTGRFYRHTAETGTIYIRLDDDIVWQHPQALRNLVDKRIDQPEPFVVFANIWNNAVCSALQWQAGNITLRPGLRLNVHCMDPLGWGDGPFAEGLHRRLLEDVDAGRAGSLYLPDFELRGEKNHPIRFSVSCFAWFGHDFWPHVDDLWEREEEGWITGQVPKATGRFNLICGDALVSHYSFFKQRPHLDQTDILAEYVRLSEDALHDAYYDLLGAADDS